MINLAVIGTNWITDSFIDAALQTGHFKLSAVYSRTVDKAAAFAQKYLDDQNNNITELTYFDSLEELAISPEVDAVYIASPNVLHFEHSLLMLKHHKHVICEKPIASTPKQLNQMRALAKENRCVLFEALKTYYLPNYQIIKDHLAKLGQLRHVTLNFCQYSSRYQRFLDGENPNTFNLAFDNGSVMDIGVYCISFAVGLFGKPLNVNASASLLSSGVDACGVIQLIFELENGEPFELVINHSKVSNGYIPSEIQGENGALIIEHLSHCEQVTWIDRLNNERKNITEFQHENTMYYEAELFAKLISEQSEPDNFLELLNNSQIVNNILMEVREQTNVKFACDND